MTNPVEIRMLHVTFEFDEFNSHVSCAQLSVAQIFTTTSSLKNHQKLDKTLELVF